jgi:biotin operon repressor
MDKIDNKLEVRSLKDGDWYWIQRAVIKDYAAKIGGTAIAVYNFLAAMADRNQSCFPSQKYIARKIGYSRSTVNRSIKRLEEHSLIGKVKRSRYHCVYHLLKVRSSADKIQMSKRENSDVPVADTNDNTIKRIINNSDIGLKNSNSAYKDFKPETREELLALDLATALNDLKALPLYLSYSKKYPEHFLRRIASEVKDIPDNKIKKGRGALFNYIIQKYAQKKSDSSRN